VAGVERFLLGLQVFAVAWLGVAILIVPSQQVLDPWILSLFVTYGVPLVLFFGPATIKAVRSRDV
jgi:hypothetical protein